MITSEELLKKELFKRKITVLSEKTYAGNNIRYFFWEGQKVYFDSQKTNGGTHFDWDNEDLKNLTFIIDRVKKDDAIYYDCAGEFESDFDWGRREYLTRAFFAGCWIERDGKICKKVG